MKQLTPRWIALVTITAITLYIAWLIFQPFVGVLFSSLVLAIVAAPLHRVISRYNRSPTVSSMLTVLAVIVIVVIPLLFILNAVLGHFDEAMDAFQQSATKLTDPESTHMKWLERYVDVKRLTNAADLREQAKKEAANIASYAAGILSWTALTLLQVLLVLFTTFYMLRDGGKLLDAARKMLPLNRSQADSVFQSIQTIISASLRGTVLIAAIQGILGGLAFWALGIKAAALWGVVMFFMSMVPVVGSSLIWVPAAIYLLASGSTAKAIILVIWGAGVIAMVDNILRPILVGSKTRMHELTVFFSVLGGLKLFGPLGIVGGPIVVALGVGLLRIFEESVRETEETETVVLVTPVSSAAAPAAPIEQQRPESTPPTPPSKSL